MADLVKFRKSKTVSQVTGSGSDKSATTVDFTTDTHKVILNGEVYGEPNAVTSVAGKTGAVTLEKGDVGLGNVDNTADANKSVAYASKIGSSSSHPSIGDTDKPVYVNSSGEITAITASKGSTTKPVYFDNGQIKEGTQLGNAAYKGVDTYIDSSATHNNLPTSLAIKTYTDNLVKTLEGDVTLAGTVDASTQIITFNSDFLPDPPSDFTFEDFMNALDDEYPWMRTGLVLVVSRGGSLVEKTYTEEGQTQYRTEDVEAGDQIIVVAKKMDPQDDESWWTATYIQRNVDKATGSVLGLVKVPTANGLSVDNNGAVKVDKASTTGFGTIKVQTGNGLSLNEGVLSMGAGYSLPLAADGTRGGIQIGATASDSTTGGVTIPLTLDSEKAKILIPYATSTSGGVVRIGQSSDDTDGSTNSKYIAYIRLDSNKKAHIILPYATTTTAGAMSASDKSKLHDLPTNSELTTTLAGKKNTQSAVSDPTANGNATSFIDTISQNTQGVISVTKKTVPDAAVASSGSSHTKGLITSEMIDALIWH